MIDTKQELVSALQTTGYDVYYELFLQKVDRPCITYVEVDNYETLKGDTLKYSNVSYELKFYSKSLADIDAAVSLIDQALDEIGYDRYFSDELMNGDFIVKIMRYEADVQEYL